MRVWLYARLSNDDAREMNSLLNQQEICRAFAEQHRHKIVGESFDDNVSGMKFSRRGLDELSAAVDAGRVDAVIVKDDCVNIELKSESPQKCGFCDVSSVF